MTASLLSTQILQGVTSICFGQRQPMVPNPDLGRHRRAVAPLDGRAIWDYTQAWIRGLEARASWAPTPPGIEIPPEGDPSPWQKSAKTRGKLQTDPKEIMKGVQTKSLIADFLQIIFGGEKAEKNKSRLRLKAARAYWQRNLRLGKGCLVSLQDSKKKDWFIFV